MAAMERSKELWDKIDADFKKAIPARLWWPDRVIQM
jgi:hypothetical protein